MGPVMGSLKSPRATSYRSSIDTIPLNCLVFEKIAFLCTVMYNVLSGLAACGRLGVAARPACLFGTRPVARDQRHASHVGATPVSQMGGSNLPRPHLVIFYFFPSA